ncbi:MAG: rubrerythrin family protein [Sulfolobales archaeon]|nr:rubrerythrin family protein [Sulfolobales archaeon]
MDGVEEARKFCKDEYEAYGMYTFLAKNPLVTMKVKRALDKAALDEYRHYVFWRNIAGECSSTPSTIKGFLLSLLLPLFGVTVIIKFIESMEKSGLELYREISLVKPELKEEVEKIIKEEEEHEASFISGLDEGRVKYLGSIMLGISDALVELTGIYSGALGVFANTLSAGLTGLLAGISAAISMAIASYAQAKHEVGKAPKIAALYTGIAYLLVVLLLALPYFLANAITSAFAAMIVVALLVIAYMSFYSSVLFKKNYLREFIETSGLMLGVSTLLFMLGNALGQLFGVTTLHP